MSSSEPLKLMIFGAPAAGKGTQCEKLVEKYGLVHISVGDLLRAEVKEGTQAGQKAKTYMDQGQLVPNEVVVDMVKSKINSPQAQEKGWLLDGYPRSKSQADAIELEKIRPDIFLQIDIPDEILLERVTGRRQDPETGQIYHLKFKPPSSPSVEKRLVQRSDDNEDKMKSRLQVYNANLQDVVGVYQDVVVKIKGDQDIDEVFKDIVKSIQSKI